MVVFFKTGFTTTGLDFFEVAFCVVAFSVFFEPPEQEVSTRTPANAAGTSRATAMRERRAEERIGSAERNTIGRRVSRKIKKARLNDLAVGKTILWSQ